MAARDPNAHPIEQEIVQEKADTLARVAERMEMVLAALEVVEREVAGAAPPSEEALARREKLRAEAAEWLWFLVVQREAVGVTHHDALYETYRIPGVVRRLMGPKRRTAASG